MSPWLLVPSHLLAFAAGAAMWRWIAMREGRALMKGEDRPRKFHRLTRPVTVRAAILVVVSCFIMGIGGQQYLWQHQKNAQAACVNRWGQDVTNALTARSDANTDLDKAKGRRDDAVDGIIAVVVAFQSHPPKATSKDFATALAEWVDARAHLDRVQQRVSTIRANHQFPELNCG